MATDLIQSKPTVSIVRATKGLVDSLLDMNTRNRDVRPQTVLHYRRMIEDGRWLVTNQGIGVSKTGILLDGQHRLMALREAGYPIVDVVLALGLSEDVAAAVDQGANRSARDYLHFLFNEKVSALVAAILRTLMVDASDGWNTHSVKYDPTKYADALLKYGDSISKVASVEGYGKLPAASLAAFVDAVHKGYEAEALGLLTDVATGEMLAKDSPALVLKRFLDGSRGHGGKDAMNQRFHKTRTALAAHIDGRTLTKVYGKKQKLRQQEQRV